MTWLANFNRRIRYYDKTSQDMPAELLIEALKFAPTGTALDIGCGAGVETKELVRRGFSVTALDINPEVSRYYPEAVIQSVEDFVFTTYDLIFAKNSLVFLSPKKFVRVISHIKTALNSGGIFAARLWGIHDSHNRTRRNYKYTFLSLNQIKSLFECYEFLKLSQSESDGLNAYNKMKHWHFIDVIVRKE